MAFFRARRFRCRSARARRRRKDRAARQAYRSVYVARRIDAAKMHGVYTAGMQGWRADKRFHTGIASGQGRKSAAISACYKLGLTRS